MQRMLVLKKPAFGKKVRFLKMRILSQFLKKVDRKLNNANHSSNIEDFYQIQLGFKKNVGIV